MLCLARTWQQALARVTAFYRIMYTSEKTMLPDILNYEPPDRSSWQGRQDSLPGERFFQQVIMEDIRTHSLTQDPDFTAIIGFCSDEGIRRNEGRIGAKEGPRALREQLGKLACHRSHRLIDLGNIVCDDDLALAQNQLATLIHYCHQHQYKTLALGGGHDIAWGHFSGLTTHYSKLGIINFDAHFDLRPLIRHDSGTSGTPFWQIKQHCADNNLAFNYCCLGIQPHANTPGLFAAAKSFNVSYLTAEQINKNRFAWQTTFIDEFLLNHANIYLSVCLDVFAECYAPGVSAPQSLGLSPWQALPLLKYIMQSGKVVGIDIAELSPPLDDHQKTARLAAFIIAEMLEFN